MSWRHSLPLLLGRLTERLPPHVDEAFWRFLRLPKPISLWRLSGLTHASINGSLLASSADAGSAYFTAQFFQGSFETQYMGTVSPFFLQRRLTALQSSFDLILFRTDRVHARWFIKKEYYKVPEWVRSGIRVPGDVQKLAAGHNSLRQDLRLIRKYGFAASTCSAEEEFQTFYHKMYRPHVTGRHGANAVLRSERNLRSSWKRGDLLMIKEADRAVAGIVVQKISGRLAFTGIGVLGGDLQLLKKGALSACYFFGLQYAQKKNIAWVDLGGTRPCTHDNLLKYKRKWGARIETKPVHVNDYIVHWPRMNSAVAAFLERCPLIVRDGRGLAALNLADPENRAMPLLPGLTREIEISRENVAAKNVT